MKNIITLLLALVALSSCVKESEYSGTDFEARSLKAWMKKNHPELMGNYQTEGGYYVDVLEWGDMNTPAEGNDFGSLPIMEQDTCWVYYNYTGYDLDGNLCSTRNEALARMQATYADRTYYAPYGNYCGKEEYYAVVEGSYLASRNKITLSQEYVDAHSDICKGTELQLRKGTKVRLYLASTIGYSASGSSAEGGYEGQYSLDPNVPMILDLEVVRVIKSPSDNELNMVESVVNQSNADNENIWMQIENTEESDTDEEGGDTAEDSSDTEDTEGKEEEKKYYEGIYYTNTFKPMDEEFYHLQYARTDVAGVGNPYKDSSRFANMEEFDAKLWKILNEKFKDQIKKVNEEDAKEIGEENAGMIWYVGRFLDGFIFDTNIDEVKELAFNETDGGGEAISYSISSNKDEYINAWALGIPKMRYGRWGAIITTSGYAYGSSGVSGSTSTSSASAYNSLANLYNYYSMTGSSYFNSYSYYNYYNYYGGYTNYYDYEDTTTTIDTEIGPYTPLVFYIFVEPRE